MSFFAFMIMIFAFSRLTRGGGWRHRRRMRMRMLGWSDGDHPFAHLRRGRYARAGFDAPAQVAAPAPSPFEALKTRYVAGELSDLQYETALDALLKTPEGRSSMR